MFARIKTAGLSGIEGFPVDIEADVQNGLPGLIMTGVLSTETREAQSRVWNAIRSCRFKPEPKKITVNFSPAFVRKEGTAYDLPIAVAVLCGYGIADYKAFSDTAFFGELGLDGSLKGIRGTLPLAFSLKKDGIKRLIVAEMNAAEAKLVDEVEVIGCSSINDVIDVLKSISAGRLFLTEERRETEHEGKTEAVQNRSVYDVDFAEVRGQKYLRRAAEIAVSGMHNFMMSGPAGTGKTMIAKRMPTIMPELSRDENIEISKAYSICGLLPEGEPLLFKRPFRNPHYSITAAAFAGGGANVMPGEITLASGGILLLDELPLFSKTVLEMLRMPLEDRFIKVTRMKGSYIYPADFLMVAAMNCCPCGYFPDRRRCRCTDAQIRAYMGHLSKPLVERIDICAEASPVSADEIVGSHAAAAKGESSAAIRERVKRVHEIQRKRFADSNTRYNGRMGIKEIEKYCVLGENEEKFIREAFSRKRLSGRTYHKIMRVARTIADMDESQNIGIKHLAEAVELRSIEDRIFG